ncbi:MAG: hypothetical protein ABJD07_01165 [Gemmatimonadaceae bacterium]
MNTIAAAVREVWGLFVEDGSFTAAILLCIALAVSVVPRSAIPPSWRAPLLFIALAFVLVENVRRSARATKTNPEKTKVQGQS